MKLLVHFVHKGDSRQYHQRFVVGAFIDGAPMTPQSAVCRPAPEGWRSSAFCLRRSLLTYRDTLVNRSLVKARIAASKCSGYYVTNPNLMHGTLIISPGKRSTQHPAQYWMKMAPTVWAGTGFKLVSLTWFAWRTKL